MLQSWLSFISTLIWQAIAIYVLVRFRRQLATAFSRGIKKLSIPGAEIEFQQEAATAAPPSGETRRELALVALQDEDGFFTEAGIARLIEKSEGGRVVQHLLLFATGRQHTWLSATSAQLFCILDDSKTRASGRLIQWVLPLGEAQPIRASGYKPAVGLLNVGPKRDWLYSRSLFPTPSDAEEAVRALVDNAARVRT